MPLSELLADWDASEEAMLESVRAMTADDLAAKVPWGEGEMSKAEALAFYVFHEGLPRRSDGFASADCRQEEPARELRRGRDRPLEDGSITLAA